MTKAERTRSYIIEVTAPLFNTRGYAGTSVAELCKATGMTKGALYGNFENKEELAAAAFYYSIKKMRSYGNQSVDSRMTYREKLVALLEFFARCVLSPPVRGGCPLLNTAIEADDHRQSMKKAVAIELEQSVSSFANLLEKGKAAGEFKRNFKPRELAMFFFCALEGAIMYSRVSSSEEAMRMVVKNVKGMVDGLC